MQLSKLTPMLLSWMQVWVRKWLRGVELFFVCLLEGYTRGFRPEKDKEMSGLLFRCASTSCTDGRNRLTVRNWRLAISHVWQVSHYLSRILSNGNYLSGQHESKSVWSRRSVCSPQSFWYFCMIFNLNNFKLYLAHLWTDFQSCYISPTGII